MDKEGGSVLTIWNNQVFNHLKIEEGKGFLLTIGEYKSVEAGQFVIVAIMNVYSPC